MEVITRRRGLSAPEGHVLSYLLSYESTPVLDLRRAIGLKGSTLSSMLSRLEKGSLLRRRPNPDDRRVPRVELTSRGRKVAREMQDEAESFEDEIARRVRPGEMRGFCAVLRALERVSQEHLDHTTEGADE
jgi:DNA-binding MarR family transcriptional regulator